MRGTFFITLILLATPLVLAQDAKVAAKYVGAENCKMCHQSEKQGSQYSIWKGSEHAKAFEALKSDKANKIAADKGFKTAAAETPECLKCHASGYNVDASLKDAKFKVEDGVQCETCHGAGSEYKNMKVMKSKPDAIAKGLIVHENIEAFCVTCHNAESPTFTKFAFAESWEKIKHTVPAEKK